MITSQKKWQTLGKDPDYRFSLANERTFLAWIRTSMAMLAGAIGIEQFAILLEPEVVRTGLALLLSIGGLIFSGMAFFRWKENEIAMRLDIPLPYTRLTSIITLLIVTFSISVCSLIILQGYH